MEPDAVKPPEPEAKTKAQGAGGEVSPPASPTPPVAPPPPETDEFSAAILNPEPPKPKSLEERKDEAAAAMAGPELIAKHELETKRRALKAEQATIKARLEEIAKQKERLELKWISLDDTRAQIKTALAPLLEKENQIEATEQELELKENQIPTPKERREVEEKIWQAEDSRRAVEKEKWVVEEKLIQTEDAINEETKDYRALLDEEDTLWRRLEEIETALDHNH